MPFGHDGAGPSLTAPRSFTVLNAMKNKLNGVSGSASHSSVTPDEMKGSNTMSNALGATLFGSKGNEGFSAPKAGGLAAMIGKIVAEVVTKRLRKTRYTWLVDKSKVNERDRSCDELYFTENERVQLTDE